MNFINIIYDIKIIITKIVTILIGSIFFMDFNI